MEIIKSEKHKSNLQDVKVVHAFEIAILERTPKVEQECTQTILEHVTLLEHLSYSVIFNNNLYS